MAQSGQKTISGPQEVARQVEGLALAILQAHGRNQLPALVGIRTGGAHLALRIQKEMERLAGRLRPGSSTSTCTATTGPCCTPGPRWAKPR